MRRLSLLRARAALTLGLGLSGLALLAPLASAKPGDLYVGDSSKVLRIDPKTKKVGVAYKGDPLGNFDGGAFTAPGRLVIADYGLDSVLKINLKTRNAQTLAVGGFATSVTDVAVGSDGKIYAAAPFAGNALHGAISQITGGNAQFVSDAQFFNQGPLGIAVLPNGTILTSDQNAGPGGTGGLLEVDPDTGTQTFVTYGNMLQSPYGMTLSKDNRFAFLADPFAGASDGAIIRVNLATGAQKTIASGPKLGRLTDVAMGLDGKLYVVTLGEGGGRVLRVDPKTGNKTIIARGGKLNSPEGITVEPRFPR